MSKIIDSQLSIYQNHFKAHGDTPEGTYNQNEAIQDLRFQRLIKQFTQQDSEYSIHDVGCGICDLHQYLINNELKLVYSGTDIVPEMKKLAVEKFPKIDFKVRDIIEDDTSNEQYDFLVLAGTFNIPGDCALNDWVSFTNEMIRKMFSMAKLGISFNFLTTNADFFHPDMYYRNPYDVFDFCSKHLSRHIVIDQAYPLYEYPVTVFSEEYMLEIHTDPKFKKYMKSYKTNV